MRLVFASTNPHKAQEIRELLASFQIDVRSALELRPDLPSPGEDADTFEGNAQLKAQAYAAALGVPCLADDSGLEVIALNGAPGLHSARYAGIGDTRATRDQANRDKLLAELKVLGEVDRSARLVCALCLVDAQGQVLFSTRGSVSAHVTHQAQGAHGFGYDSLLWIAELGQTIAEMPEPVWNARSHRALAVQALAAFLKANPSSAE
jgi:XTP/dITP diphosphohydrolase